MSFSDRLVLWLHIGFAIFTIGPVTIAAMSTPRYIRKGNIPVVRYLSRMTRVLGLLSLGVLLFGLILAQSKSDFSHPWLTISTTLFVVAAVLMLIVMRDQHRAIAALETASDRGAGTGDRGAGTGAADLAEVTAAAEEPSAAAEPAGASEATPPRATAAAVAAVASTGDAAGQSAAAEVATVERGRIASMAGVVSLIWLVILVLMVWNG
jgi:hypothetical protein